jgi:pre-mRNA-splicing helicase BRR2
MSLNPNYYGLQGASNDHLSEHLSELVETTLNDLVSSKCISISDDYEVSPLNLGMIAAYYRINYLTMEMMGMSLNSTTKLKGLLEILCASSEFDGIPIRHGEELILNRIYDRVPVKTQKPSMNSPSLKANILVQSHFSRTALPADLESDQREILLKILPLLQACVDVISSNGWLNPAISAMEMSQMIVQGMWDRDSPLKQLPYFDSKRIDMAKAKVSSPLPHLYFISLLTFVSFLECGKCL